MFKSRESNFQVHPISPYLTTERSVDTGSKKEVTTRRWKLCSENRTVGSANDFEGLVVQT